MIAVSPSQATAVSPGSSSEVAQTRTQSDMAVARAGGRPIVGAAEAAFTIPAPPGKTAARTTNRSRRPPRLQCLLEHFEAQVVAFRHAEALVAVRERLVGAGAAVAAAFVEGDQLVADVDHRHPHVRQPPFLARDALALGQQRLADAGALQVGDNREHAEVAVPVLVGHVRAGQQLLPRTRSGGTAAL